MRKLINNTMKRTLCICMAWLGLGLAVQAQTCRLTTSATSIAQGKEAMLDVTLANEVEISGGQFTVTLPQGITIKDVRLNAERSTNHTLEYRLEGGNSAKILFYAKPTAPLKDNGGTLCTLALEAASDVAGGEYKVAFSKVRLAVDATTIAEVNTVEGTLKVIPCYTIKVEATEGGSVEGGGIFVEGDRVTLKAIPDEGYHFEQWSDGSTDTPYTFEAKEHVTLTAKFAPNAYNLIYVIDGVEYKRVSVLYKSEVEGIAVEAREGHTFSGWSGLPATMPARDVTVNGSFTVNKYLVTFKIGDVVVSSKSLAYGTAIVAPAAPEKEGYTFDGWGEVAETVPARDVTYEGSYSVNSYKLTYMVDGEKYQEETVAYGTALTAPNAPTKEGYTFSGWIGLPATMPARDVTVNGSFTVNKYLVTFKIGDVVVSSKSLEYGTAIVAPSAPEKEGYTFDGWGEVAETVPAHDVTYEGSYSVNSYTLTYMVDGEKYWEETVAYGTVLTAPNAPTKEGFTFSGWIGLPATMPAKDVTVIGSFVTNGYTLTYVVDGEVYKTLVYAYGSAVIAEPMPTKEGYTFSGWVDLPATMPANDVTVSGTFTINTYRVTFKIGDEVIYSESLEYGSTIVVPEAPEKEGYTFDGWGEVAETVPAHDVTYEGSYSANSYKLTYMVDGEKYREEMVAYGTVLTAIDAPEKEGHTFSGWSGLPATMPASDVTVSGTFTINTYRVTFKIGDEVIYSESLEYGSTIVVPEAPEKEGYTFDGWGEVAETVPAHDVTYEGSYSANSYKLTYMVDGEKYREEMVAYGTVLTAIDAPEKEGHTFSGWSGLPATMPASDVTVSGTFTINEYTVTFYDWDGTVLKRQTVVHGQDATPPADPTREGYTFIGWDFDYTNVVWDLAVHAEYVKNAETVYTVEYHAGANGWIDGADWHAHDLRVAGFASPLYRAQGKVEKLRFTVSRTKGYTKYFCLSELEFYDANGNKIELSASSFKSNADHNTLNPNHPDGGSYGALVDGQMGTYFHSAWQNMPAEDHWIEVTLPNGGYDTFWFRMLSRAYSTENGVINDQSHTFPGEMVMTTSVALVEIEQPDVPELDNASLYHVTLPYRDNVSWAVAQGGQVLSINTILGLVSDGADSRQQFAFISNDGGTTHYLYHPAECKYVNKDGSLGTTAKDAVYFKRGVYPGTFVVYFDNAHFINTNERDGLIINDWGPGGRMGTADGGNSCKITPVGRFDITNIDFLSGEDTGRVQKVFENGEMFILLPDGSKYTTTGVRVK